MGYLRFPVLGLAQRPWLTATLSALAALCSSLAMLGFTVDDALISARVAAHLHAGLGYRFNPAGPVVDAVTPLGWAHLLAPLATSPLTALNVAKAIGVFAWTLAAGYLGLRVHRLGRSWARFAPLLVLPLSLPLAGWAAAGMETGLVLGLSTLALSSSRWALYGLGVLAAWRPELIPWALSVGAASAIARGSAPQRVMLSVSAVLLPAAAVGAVRLSFFGSAAPLSLMAKPSDLEHGLFYAAAALLWTGFPLLLLARRDLTKLRASSQALLFAAVVHVFVLVLAGGDWMPFFRLAVPVLPSLIIVAADLAEQSRPWKTWTRTGLALLPCVLLWREHGAAATLVTANRERNTQALRPLVQAHDRLATLDVGWVGATTDAEVIDLAGVSDPRIARLKGGHTSKQLPRDFFERFSPTLVVALTRPGASSNAAPGTGLTRTVEQRLFNIAQERGIAIEEFSRLPLLESGLQYIVFRVRYSAP